jgi:hypothetical protein
MRADVRGPRAAWRSARECALGLCAAWLVVQNIVLVIALFVGGPSAAWHALTPVLGLACVLMTPLWLVPAILMFAGARRGRREACRGTHEVTQ